jgi:hypothetical protein
MIRSLVAGLEQNAYHMAVRESSFNPETLDVEVESNDNQSELDLLEVEQDLGLADIDSEVGEPDGQQKVVLEMVDARAKMDMMNGGKGDSMVAGSGASRATGFEGSVGASTVNPDCPVMKMEVHVQRAIENATLKGRLADSATETQCLKKEVQSCEMKEIGAFMAALLAGWPNSGSYSQEKFQHMAAIFSKCLPAHLAHVMRE